jgi:hypothetical protein
MQGTTPQPHSNALSVQSKTSLTASQQKLAVEINLTALNSKAEPERELVAEFTRVFDHEPPEAIEWAFREWRLQSSFFPAIADIAELISRWHGGADHEDGKKIEANAAWDYVNRYLHKWGVDLLPLYSNGKVTTPPPLDSRIDYALRRIGGLKALNQVDVDKMPFMYRDFCEAYRLAPVAELMAGSLQQQFGEGKLLGNIKQLGQARSLEVSGKQPTTKRLLPKVERSDEWYAERRAKLKQMADELLAKRKK